MTTEATTWQLAAHQISHREARAIATYVQEPIAVVGLSCRLPGDSNSPKALWDFLERGGIAQNDPPKTRFNLQGHYDGSKKNKTMRTAGGMFLENIDPADFDAGFFGISHVDAVAMDPQQRQLLEIVYEGLENAGLNLEALDGAAVGCFVGSYAVGKSIARPLGVLQIFDSLPTQIISICTTAIPRIDQLVSPLEWVVLY